MTIKVTKAIFPAAGLGTRFLPATKAQAKEMLPLVDKPLIQCAVEEAVASGITDSILITSRGKENIEDHFDANPELEMVLSNRGKSKALAGVKEITDLCRMAFVRQKEALGLGHAVYTANSWVNKGEAVAVLLADDILDCKVPCLKQMIDAFQKVQAPIIAAMEVPEDQTHRYGIFKVEPAAEDERLLRLVDMVEKPGPGEAPSNLAAIGRYILTDDVFRALETTTPGAGGEIQLTDAFRQILKDKPVYAYKFDGRRFDGGDKLGFLEATIHFALANPELGEDFKEMLRNFKIDL